MSGQSGIEIVLVGQDGTAWNLVDPDSPVALLADAVDGFHVEEISPQVQTLARIPGQRRIGRSIKPRSIDLSVRIGDVSPPFRVGDAWRALDSTFFKSIGVGDPCTLWVDDRSIEVRLDASTPGYSRDPALIGKGVYQLEFTADWPYFMGSEVVFNFDLAPVNAQNFFGGGSGTKGPPFYITQAQASASAALSNMGDADAWLRWTMVGPGTFTVGVGSNIISIPFALARDQIVVIDTDPRVQTIINAATGQNLWPSMGTSPVRFTPVAPGDSQPIIVQANGAQSGTMVSAAITPQYSRAW